MLPQRYFDQLRNMLFLDFNFLLKTMDIFFSMFSASLTKYLNRFDGCFFFAVFSFMTDKNDLIDAFYVVFGLSINENQFFLSHEASSSLG